MSDDELQLPSRLYELPLWRDAAALSWQPLAGGLSNRSFVVEDRGERYVARSGRDFPFHHVDRGREQMTARAAFAAGFAPELVYAEPGLMVSRFIDGRTYTAAEVRADLARIAELVRNFHQRMPAAVSGPGYLFWPFHVIRDYARTLAAGGSRMRDRVAGFVALGDELEAAQTPLPIVFGHHDLLPANFIDDGERLWLIDFEYAGFGTAMFDLAGLSSLADFDAEQSDELLARYFGRTPDEALRRSLAAMQCASLLREAMWSMVSELYLEVPGVDYHAYTEENLQRLDAALGRYRAGRPRR